MTLSKLQLSELLTVYGDVLTDIQKYATAMYCDYDCSLSEIAAERGISRQGVRDAIVKAEASLIKLEENLRLAQNIRSLRVALDTDDLNLLKQTVKQYVSKE